MKKNFLSWFQIKPKLHENASSDLYFYERDVFYAHLGINIGFEQDGKGENFERPIVVLKKFNAHCMLIVPLTTKEKKGRFYFPFQIKGQKKKSYAILSQVRLIDGKRFINKIGRIEKKTLIELKKAIKQIID